MTPEYSIFLNDNYFDALADEAAFGDRPEAYRRHEKTLWTAYQLLRLGEHEVVITDQTGQPAIRTKSAEELAAWFKWVYPRAIGQLDQPVYTSLPHPADQLQLPG